MERLQALEGKMFKVRRGAGYYQECRVVPGTGKLQDGKITLRVELKERAHTSYKRVELNCFLDMQKDDEPMMFYKPRARDSIIVIPDEPENPPRKNQNHSKKRKAVVYDLDNQVSSKERSKQCVICQEQVFCASALYLTCFHGYHAKCILEWAPHASAAGQLPCPQCKQGDFR